MPIPPQSLRAAARTVDLTPPVGTAIAGYGPRPLKVAGQPDRGAPYAFSRGVAGRLRATVIVLEDDEGHRLALVAADLHSGPGYLCERIVAAAHDAGLDLDPRELVLCSSHAHAGPGHFFRNNLYDAATAPNVAPDGDPATVRFGAQCDVEATEALARPIGQALAACAREVDAATLVVAEHPLWGLLWQRSLDAFEAERAGAGYADARAAASAINGAPPPDGMPDDRLAVDARLQLLWLADAAGAPLAGVALLHATPTALPGRALLCSGDVARLAADHAAAQLAAKGLRPPPLSIVAGAHGDTNVVDPTAFFAREFLERRWELHVAQPTAIGDDLLRLRDLVDGVARPLGDALATAAQQAQQLATGAATAASVDVRFARHLIAGQATASGPTATRPEAGRAAMQGSELSRDPADPPESIASPRRRGPQAPKRRARWTELLLSLALGQRPRPPERWPFQIARIGPVTLATVPAEPSVWLAHEIRRALGESAGAPVFVIGNSGEYAGYVVTEREYDVQAYEGGSQWFGRTAGRWVVERLADLAAGPTQAWSPPTYTGKTAAVRQHHLDDERPEAFVGPGDPPPRLWVNDGGDTVTLRGEWRVPREGTSGRGEALPLGEHGPWIVFFDADTGQDLALWPATQGTTWPLDDARWPFWLVRTPMNRVSGERHTRWAFVADVPREALGATRLLGYRITAPPDALPADGVERQAIAPIRLSAPVAAADVPTPQDA